MYGGDVTNHTTKNLRIYTACSQQPLSHIKRHLMEIVFPQISESHEVESFTQQETADSWPASPVTQKPAPCIIHSFRLKADTALGA